MVGARVSDRYRVIEPRPHRDRGEWCAVMDNPNTEYSRDVVGALKERADAPSMMAKHASAQKEAMQEACLGALRRALPGASAETCMMALETAGWDVDNTGITANSANASLNFNANISGSLAKPRP